MKIYLKFDFNTICRKILEEKLNEKGLKYVEEQILKD